MKKFLSVVCIIALCGNQFLFAFDQEVLMALQDLYDQGINTASMQNTSPDDTMARREAAILMDKYTDQVSGTPKGSDGCQFYDLTMSEGIKQSIVATCQKGIFKGNAGFFSPYAMMTRGQLIIVMARLLSGDPTMEIDTAYDYLLRTHIIKIDDRSHADRLINKSELYIMLSRNISGSASMSTADPLHQIFKVKSYEKDAFFGTVTNIGHGSAVVIDDNILLTNAHVVVDEDQKPTGMYEVCKSVDMHSDPVCFTYADLVYYDLENDLALLALPSNANVHTPVILATKSPAENDQITTYGYPRDGGDTITSAKGVVSGYEKGMIKTDAAINFGNSGGGAYDKYGRLVGIPTQVADNIGYLIPVSTIQKFIAKEGSITEDDTPIDPSFVQQIQASQHKTNAHTIQEDQFMATNLGTFTIRDVTVDKDPSLVNYTLSSPDKETQVLLGTSKIYGQKNMTSIHQQMEQFFDDSFTHRSTGTFQSGANSWSIYSGQGSDGSADSLFVVYSLNRPGSLTIGALINSSTNKKESIKDAVRLITSIQTTGKQDQTIAGDIHIGPLTFHADDFMQVVHKVGNDISFTLADHPLCDGYITSDISDYDPTSFTTLADAGAQQFDRYDSTQMIDQGIIHGSIDRYRGYTKDDQDEYRTIDYYTYVYAPQDKTKVVSVNLWFNCKDTSQAVFDQINDWVKTVGIDADSIF